MSSLSKVQVNDVFADCKSGSLKLTVKAIREEEKFKLFFLSSDKIKLSLDCTQKCKINSIIRFII